MSHCSSRSLPSHLQYYINRANGSLKVFASILPQGPAVCLVCTWNRDWKAFLSLKKKKNPFPTSGKCLNGWCITQNHTPLSIIKDNLFLSACLTTLSWSCKFHSEISLQTWAGMCKYNVILKKAAQSCFSSSCHWNNYPPVRGCSGAPCRGEGGGDLPGSGVEGRILWNIYYDKVLEHRTRTAIPYLYIFQVHWFHLHISLIFSLSHPIQGKENQGSCLLAGRMN